MNTSEVAKLLGVSASTIQRWVKQLGLPMEKNERGHYYFCSDDINLLKEIHEQLQKGTLLHEITSVNEQKRVRKGSVKANDNEKAIEKLSTKISELEISLNAKADSVASYQLLQHRREIEELQDHVKNLTQHVNLLQNQLNNLTLPVQIEKPIVFDQSKDKKKKKRFVSSIFGF